MTFFIQITLFVTFERYLENLVTGTINIYPQISISYIRHDIIHLVGRQIALYNSHGSLFLNKVLRTIPQTIYCNSYYSYT